MSNQRILITLRADQDVRVRHEALVRRAQDAGRSVNTQMLLELGYIDEQMADSIPRVGRYSRVLARHMPNICRPPKNDASTDGTSRYTR